MELSRKERLFLSNQLKILEGLYPEEADYYKKHRKAIEEGYSLHYKWITENLYEEMPEEKCKEVINILDMYRALTFSYKDFEDKSDIPKSKIEFPGFDGNNETVQMNYTEYFINDLNRFNELKDDSDYPDYNIHIPMLRQYRKMLSKWDELDRKRNLSKDEIIEILEV